MAKAIPPIEQLRSRTLGRVLIKMGILTRDKVHQCLQLQKKRGSKVKIGQIFIELGLIDEKHNMHATRSVIMQPEKETKSGKVTFTGAIPCVVTGNHGFTVRILPNHPNLAHRFEMNLVTWAG